MNKNLNDYANYFDDNSLSKKLKKAARKIGKKATYYVLVLYYVARDPSVPQSEKLKVLAALGYFILPIDLIPDFIIGLGFGDDILALVWAVWSMRKYITPEMKRKAREHVRRWFGDDGETFDVARRHTSRNGSQVIDVEAVEY